MSLFPSDAAKVINVNTSNDLPVVINIRCGLDCRVTILIGGDDEDVIVTQSSSLSSSSCNANSAKIQQSISSYSRESIDRNGSAEIGASTEIGTCTEIGTTTEIGIEKGTEIGTEIGTSTESGTEIQTSTETGTEIGAEVQDDIIMLDILEEYLAQELPSLSSAAPPLPLPLPPPPPPPPAIVRVPIDDFSIISSNSRNRNPFLSPTSSLSSSSSSSLLSSSTNSAKDRTLVTATKNEKIKSEVKEMNGRKPFLFTYESSREAQLFNHIIVSTHFSKCFSSEELRILYSNNNETPIIPFLFLPMYEDTVTSDPKLLNDIVVLINTPFSRDYSNEELRIMHRSDNNKIPNMDDYLEVQMLGYSDAERIKQTIFNNALFKAVEEDNILEFNKAVEAGADVNHKFIEELKDKDKYNEKKDCEPAVSITTCLHIASSNASLPIIDRLLELQVDINFKNHKSQTSLDIALEEGHIDVVSRLIDKGADRNGKNYMKLVVKIALLNAIEYCDLARFNKAIEAGANVNQKIGTDSNEFNFPLHIATLNAFLPIINRLLELEAVIDAKNSYGETPLHLACAKGDLEVIGVLLENGADPYAEDNDEQTPLQLASSSRKAAHHFENLFRCHIEPTSQDSVLMAVMMMDNLYIYHFLLNSNNDNNCNNGNDETHIMADLFAFLG